MTLEERKVASIKRRDDFAAAAYAVSIPFSKLPDGNTLKPQYMSPADERKAKEAAAAKKAAAAAEAEAAKAGHKPLDPRFGLSIKRGSRKQKLERVEENDFEKGLKCSQKVLNKQDEKLALKVKKETASINQYRTGKLDRLSMCIRLASKGFTDLSGKAMDPWGIAAEIEANPNKYDDAGNRIKNKPNRCHKAIAALRKELLLERFPTTEWAKKELAKKAEKAANAAERANAKLNTAARKRSVSKLVATDSEGEYSEEDSNDQQPPRKERKLPGMPNPWSEEYQPEGSDLSEDDEAN
jgi:hypothetical protein